MNRHEAVDKMEAQIYGMLLLICFIMFAMGAALGFTVGKSKKVDHSGVRFHVESTPPIESTK